MRSITGSKYVCENSQEVFSMTDNLCKAHEVDIKIDDGGIIKDVDNFKGVYNSTRGEFCAAVAKGYNILSHKTYFDTFAQAMDRLNIKYKMTIKEQGNQAFADIDFIGRNLKFEKLNEEFLTGIRLANSYNKTQGIGIAPRFTRLACTNGMVLTRAEKVYSIRHNNKLAVEIEVLVEKKLNDVINRDKQLQIWISNSMADSIEWQTMVKILQKLFESHKHREEILKRLGISQIEKKKGKKTIGFEYVWDNPAQAKEKINRWDLYNAVTHYLSHGEHITPLLEATMHRKAEKILTHAYTELPMIEVPVV